MRRREFGQSTVPVGVRDRQRRVPVADFGAVRRFRYSAVFFVVYEFNVAYFSDRGVDER